MKVSWFSYAAFSSCKNLTGGKGRNRRAKSTNRGTKEKRRKRLQGQIIQGGRLEGEKITGGKITGGKDYRGKRLQGRHNKGKRLQEERLQREKIIGGGGSIHEEHSSSVFLKRYPNHSNFAKKSQKFYDSDHKL